MKILLASPRGFCAGVNMAIESLDLTLRTFGAPVYVYHEIVHNQYVVDSFRKKGAVFVDDLEEVPSGSVLLFSAHGVSPEIRRIARHRNLNAIDATCPLVTKVHLEAIKYAREGYTIFLIGHEGHDEVIGTMGEAPEAMILVETPEDVDQLEFSPEARLAYLTQTTLSVDDANRIIQRLREKFPQLVNPPKEDICYATQNRQEAVKKLAQQSDLCLVLGSQNSSNSQRLRELGELSGVPSYLIDGATDLDPNWFEGVQTILMTAGASAPEIVVNECIEWIKARFRVEVEPVIVRHEDVSFPLPKVLRNLETVGKNGKL
jgi:4-hydroxy-3-methylbut-2-en-1-yl diphosphate reductase